MGNETNYTVKLLSEPGKRNGRIRKGTENFPKLDFWPLSESRQNDCHANLGKVSSRQKRDVEIQAEKFAVSPPRNYVIRFGREKEESKRRLLVRIVDKKAESILYSILPVARERKSIKKGKEVDYFRASGRAVFIAGSWLICGLFLEDTNLKLCFGDQYRWVYVSHSMEIG